MRSEAPLKLGFIACLCKSIFFGKPFQLTGVPQGIMVGLDYLAKAKQWFYTALKCVFLGSLGGNLLWYIRVQYGPLPGDPPGVLWFLGGLLEGPGVLWLLVGSFLAGVLPTGIALWYVFLRMLQQAKEAWKS